MQSEGETGIADALDKVDLDAEEKVPLQAQDSDSKTQNNNGAFMEISHMQSQQPQINQNYMPKKTSTDQNAEFKDDLSQRERNIMKHSSIV